MTISNITEISPATEELLAMLEESLNDRFKGDKIFFTATEYKKVNHFLTALFIGESSACMKRPTEDISNE